MLEEITTAYNMKILWRYFAEKPEEVKGYDRLYYALCITDDKDIKAPGFVSIPKWFSKVNIDVPEQTLYASFNGNTRANINRARTSITFKINEDWKEFTKLCDDFHKKKKMHHIDTENLASQKNHFLVTGYHDDKMIWGDCFAIDNSTLLSRVICSYNALDSTYDRLCSQASRWCYFQAMLYAKDNGATSFVNRIEGYPNPTGTGLFKLGFGGEMFLKNTYGKNNSTLAGMLSKIGMWEM